MLKTKYKRLNALINITEIQIRSTVFLIFGKNLIT